MSEATLDQARFIFDTIQLLKLRLMPKHCISMRSDNGHAAVDLTLHQMHTLMIIESRGQLTVKELAEAMGVSAPSASSMAERLVEVGMVSREQSQEDRREVAIKLTEEGEEAFREMERTLLNSITDLLAKLGPEYSQKWCDVYLRIREALDEDEDLSAGTARERS